MGLSFENDQRSLSKVGLWVTVQPIELRLQLLQFCRPHAFGKIRPQPPFPELFHLGFKSLPFFFNAWLRDVAALVFSLFRLTKRA